MNRLLQSKKYGSAMALVLIALVMLLVTGVGILGLGAHTRMRAVQASTEIAARCAADAGLTKMVFEMNNKLLAKPWTDSNLPEATDEVLPNCDATFSYTVTADGNGYAIECTGSSGRAEKKVKAALRLQGPFEYAIFTENCLSLKNGTTIDGYNFDSAGETLQIGTNSTAAGSITAKLGTTIDGDVVVGAGGNPDVVINSKTEAAITGDTYSMIEPQELPSITVPTYFESLPSKGTLSGPATVTSTSKYDKIFIGQGDVITVDGQVTLYIIGDIDIGNSAQLQIVDANTNPDASLTLYLGGNFRCKNGGFINNLTKDATKFKLYALDSCSYITFYTAGIFYGAVYAPQADVDMKNSVEVFGSIVADNFYQAAVADFHYDASLRDAGVNDEGVRFVVKQWSDE